MTELVRKSASATNGGELDSSVTQVIPGTKTFSGTVTVSGALTASSGVVGRTDGAVVPAGMIGQVISGVAAADAAILVGGSNYTSVGSVTVSAGTWLILSTVTVNITSAGTCWYSLYNTNANAAGAIGVESVIGSQVERACGSTHIVVRPTVTTTYGHMVNLSAGSGTTNGSRSPLTAIRIA